MSAVDTCTCWVPILLLLLFLDLSFPIYPSFIYLSVAIPLSSLCYFTCMFLYICSLIFSPLASPPSVPAYSCIYIPRLPSPPCCAYLFQPVPVFQYFPSSPLPSLLHLFVPVLVSKCVFVYLHSCMRFALYR